MSLYKCPECGGRIAKIANRCPKCTHEYTEEQKANLQKQKAKLRKGGLAMILSFAVISLLMELGNKLVEGSEAKNHDRSHSTETHTSVNEETLTIQGFLEKVRSLIQNEDNPTEVYISSKEDTATTISLKGVHSTVMIALNHEQGLDRVNSFMIFAGGDGTADGEREATQAILAALIAANPQFGKARCEEILGKLSKVTVGARPITTTLSGKWFGAKYTKDGFLRIDIRNEADAPPSPEDIIDLDLKILWQVRDNHLSVEGTLNLPEHTQLKLSVIKEGILSKGDIKETEIRGGEFAVEMFLGKNQLTKGNYKLRLFLPKQENESVRKAIGENYKNLRGDGIKILASGGKLFRYEEAIQITSAAAIDDATESLKAYLKQVESLQREIDELFLSDYLPAESVWAPKSMELNRKVSALREEFENFKPQGESTKVYQEISALMGDLWQYRLALHLAIHRGEDPSDTAGMKNYNESLIRTRKSLDEYSRAISEANSL